jgi:broad specificity phosphatase PhoE
MGIKLKVKKIVFVRHPEATKNLSDKFASKDDDEAVTDLGYRQIDQLGAILSTTVSQASYVKISVVSADSARSIPCGVEIAERLGVRLIRDDRLTSIKAGQIAGVTEEAVSRDMPEYYEKLTMYRRGVISSYKLDHPGERLIDFERRVASSLLEIESSSSTLIIVCAHKSAITAALIRYARMFHDYPKDFFGFVDLPLASLSMVEIQGSKGRIACVGVDAEEIHNYL